MENCMHDELITTKEVSQILKRNRNTVYDLINARLLPRMKLGTHSKCSRIAVGEFIKKY